MIRRYCDLCNKELLHVDIRTSDTQWYEVYDGLLETKLDICNECMIKIVKATKQE